MFVSHDSLNHAYQFLGFAMAIAIFFGWHAYRSFEYLAAQPPRIPAAKAFCLWFAGAIFQALAFGMIYLIGAYAYNNAGDYSEYMEFFANKLLLCLFMTLAGYIGHAIYALFSRVDLEKSISMQDGFNAAVKEMEEKIKSK